MTGEILIVMPLPPRELSPNARVHWKTRARRTKEYRRCAFLVTCAAGGRKLGWPRAIAQATFYWPNRCRRDIRNAEHSLKAAYDGLVDAQLILDDSSDVLTHNETKFDLDPRKPRVEIRLTKKETA